MTDKTDPIAHAARLLREAAQELQQGHTLSSDRNNWIGEPEAKAAYDEHMQVADALEQWASAIGAGGVSGPLMGQPQEMPDLSALTERGAKAWAGVDAQGLREGVASAGSEPVAFMARLPSGSEVFSRTKDFYPDSIPVYTHPSPPEGMVGGWIASKDQMPPPGVRVFWGDVDSNRVGYDSWAGDDYRWAPSHWMHIPEFPAPPTTSAGSGKGE